MRKYTTPATESTPGPLTSMFRYLSRMFGGQYKVRGSGGLDGELHRPTSGDPNLIPIASEVSSLYDNLRVRSAGEPDIKVEELEPIRQLRDAAKKLPNPQRRLVLTAGLELFTLGRVTGALEAVQGNETRGERVVRYLDDMLKGGVNGEVPSPSDEGTGREEYRK